MRHGGGTVTEPSDGDGPRHAASRRPWLVLAVVLIAVACVIGAWTLLQPAADASSSPTDAPPTTRPIGSQNTSTVIATAPSTPAQTGVHGAGSTDNENGAPDFSPLNRAFPLTYGNGSRVQIELGNIRRQAEPAPGFPEPERGGYLVATVTVHAMSGKDIIIRPYRFSARVVATGATAELSIGGGGLRTTALESVVLQPGQSVSGDVAFDVPATGPIVIRYGNGTGEVLLRWKITG